MNHHHCHCGEGVPARFFGALSRCTLCGRLRDDRWSRATTIFVFALGLSWLGAVLLTLFSAG